MCWIDILILIIIGVALVRGFMKGFVYEISGLLGVIMAIYVSKNHSTFFADLIKDFFSLDTALLPMMGMAAAFFFALAVVKALSVVINKFVKIAMLGWVNNLLGALFSAMKTAFVLSIFVNIVSPVNDKFNIVNAETVKSSLLNEPIKGFAPTLLPYFNMNEIMGVVEKADKSIGVGVYEK